jgi:hypothetical protein
VASRVDRSDGTLRATADREEIRDQLLGGREGVRFIPVPMMPMMAFARLVIVTDDANAIPPV